MFLQAAHHIGLLKPGSCVAAGPSSNEVAVGDAAGVLWLFDLRQPDAPTLRLPCNAGHAVSCIRWNTRQPIRSESRSSKRSGASPHIQQTPQGRGETPSSLPSGPRQQVSTERSRHAAPHLDVRSGKNPFFGGLYCSTPCQKAVLFLQINVTGLLY